MSESPDFALLYDSRCLEHDNGSMVLDPDARKWLDVPHAEGPARIRRAMEVLTGSGVCGRLEQPEFDPAGEADLELVHRPGLIDRIRRADSEGELVRVGPEARVGGSSWIPALLSAGAAVAAVDWTLGGDGRRAYALTRPPGHHASADQAMGFCLFNNVAIAARHAQRRRGVGRIAILDWDVHHGNGTEDIFHADPEVLFISMHQENLYPPGRGGSTDRGTGPGAGFNLNIPLPPGSGDADYLAAMERQVLPAIDRFDPELILLSSGQDAAASDPLGRMSVTTEGFRRMCLMLGRLADLLCHGRLVAVQEGGYSVDHMPFCVLASIEALAGLEPSFEVDPIELDVPSPAEASGDG